MMPVESREGPRNVNANKEVRLQCAKCSGETRHTIIRSAEYVSNYEDSGFSITVWDEYQIVECNGCQALSFRHASRNTEDFDINPESGTDILNEKVTVYPYRLAGHSEIHDSYLLPSAIQRAYEETLQAMRVGMPVLAGVGIRAIVETICKDRGAKGRNLEDRIDNLVAQGVLTSDGADILHSLRIMGNDAAHEVKPHTIADLTTALTVVEHTLQGIYILQKLAAKLPKRIKGPKKK